MPYIHYRFFISCCFICFYTQIYAQPANDSCSTAIVLTDIQSWCSSSGAFTNVSATADGIGNPICFTNESHDVWFSFIATGNTLAVTAVGNTAINSGGSLIQPEVAVYNGDCNGNLNLIGCQNDAFGSNVAEMILSNLIVGITYFIRVEGRNDNTGTFQLCVNNYNAVPPPSGDCETGVILCDKSPFAVELLSGIGEDNESLDGGCLSSESSSTWYKWTCDVAGTLAFTLTPNNPADDLDFVIYELPNGIDDCSDKLTLRCMASGENVGQPLSEWIACTGGTGLIETDIDLEEAPGCQAGNNNFVSAIDMEVGKSYALIINNFSNSGNGFSIEFGGTGTFLGPTVDFLKEPDTICVGESITFTDASFFAGELEDWQWAFGQSATPFSIGGIGPHTVRYDFPGTKSVVLSVQSTDGCIVTEVKTIVVICCTDPDDLTASITDVVCGGTPTGAIDLSVNNPYSPFTFIWDNGETTEDINELTPQEYSVTVTDAATCTTINTFVVDSVVSLVAETNIIMPTCNGGTDGVFTIMASGGLSPYSFDLNDGNGFTPNNTLSGLPIGDYPVIILDANGCEIMDTLEVRELELILDPNVEAVIMPVCFGDSNGSIVLNITNGAPPYEYDWGNGILVDENSLMNIASGTYNVTVYDNNMCMGVFEFEVADHPPLEIMIDTINVSCFGAGDGEAVALVDGGFGNYSYLWSNSQSDMAANGLVPGNYTVTVLDENNCEIQGNVAIIEPAELSISLVEVVDIICFGDSTGSITVEGLGGNPPFEYSLDGVNFQSSPSIPNLFSGEYTITIRDMEGCEDQLTAFINQPAPLLVDAGPDQTIDLGFTAELDAVVSPFFRPVDFLWEDNSTLSCLDCDDPTAMPVATTTYQISVADSTGCTATDSVTVHIAFNRPIYIPNAMSPNFDGINDLFTLYGGPAASSIRLLHIFDRWGNLVYEGKDFPLNIERFGWDGTFKGELMAPATFTYYAEVGFIDNVVVAYKGDLTILR